MIAEACIIAGGLIAAACVIANAIYELADRDDVIKVDHLRRAADKADRHA